MEVRSWVEGHLWLGSPVVGSSDAVAEVIGRDMAWASQIEVVAREFPINLIEVVGVQDCTGDDACSIVDLHYYFSCPKPHVIVRPDVRSIS